MTTKLTDKSLLNDIRQLIQHFEFKKLFNLLGWENANFNKSLSQYALTAIAEKRNFVIFTCQTTDFPNQTERKKIAKQIGKLYPENIIIYFNAQKQIWQTSIKELNKPIQYKETEYYSHQEPELLFARLKGILFTLDEEDNVYLVDVIDRVKNNFNTNTEKTTKKFYDDFKNQHKAFMLFINGLNNEEDKRWYASLMLNRLMFIYFIQKKGFLNNDINYLRNKLAEVKSKKCADKFYSFYRVFLLKFFHYGLGKEHQDNKELIALIGKVPYLNGGLFDIHELEKEENNNIQIVDEAFEKLFDFFDKYQWHLNTNSNAKGNEINPDVIGYIFEKYINDRAAMGAYYTKEDITEYISKNTIIPFLFDKTKQACGNAFKADSSLWQLLKDDSNRYIYSAIQKGCEYNDIPEHIAIGIDTTQADLLARRNEWNTPTPEKFGLPTEIWRETIARRQRYNELTAKLTQGDISEINDFITYNLNIRQFTQDALAFYEGSDFIEAFYNAIIEITILDPTCGSGAFLFAALNVLEPLYEGCINRMREFVALDNQSGKAPKFKNFRAVLADIDSHTNPTYWIYKKIILNNLYGVDIMQEAVEIAKLRLFLKLAAMSEVDYKKPNLGLEPLPDIDFNIRCGNTLIGYTTHQQIKTAVETDINGQIKMFVGDAMVLIDDMIQDLQGVLRRYKENQLSNNLAGLYEDKQDIKARLAEIEQQLDWFLARDYGIDTDNQEKLSAWKQSHHPFHWFTEFFAIINKGGFDVIIGNPPYVEYSKVKKDYLIKGYETESCGNLYAFVIEKSLNISNLKGRFGMIIPISSICTDRMIGYQKILKKYSCWNSLYAERPSKLFTGAEVQLSISLLDLSENSKLQSTTYNKWGSAYRDFIFENLKYTEISNFTRAGSFPKIGNEVEKNILAKMKNKTKAIEHYKIKSSQYFVGYRNAGGRYYKVILNYEPVFKVNGLQQRSSTYQFLHFESNEISNSICAVMNSTLFFWYWLSYSDTWHMVNREIGAFPIEFDDSIKDKLILINDKLMNDLKINSTEKIENRNKCKDSVEFTQFNVRESKPIIDEIDKVLAEHYGFSEEELDFIINYDIKYRMGKELD